MLFLFLFILTTHHHKFLRRGYKNNQVVQHWRNHFPSICTDLHTTVRVDSGYSFLSSSSGVSHAINLGRLETRQITIRSLFTVHSGRHFTFSGCDNIISIIRAPITFTCCAVVAKSRHPNGKEKGREGYLWERMTLALFLYHLREEGLTRC